MLPLGVKHIFCWFSYQTVGTYLISFGVIHLQDLNHFIIFMCLFVCLFF